jgi:hypothetical protein
MRRPQNLKCCTCLLNLGNNIKVEISNDKNGFRFEFKISLGVASAFIADGVLRLWQIIWALMLAPSPQS